MHERARQLLRLLVESPDSLSRNRHFSLFEDERAAEIRRRASLLRLLRDRLLEDGAQLEASAWVDGKRMLRLRYASGLIQQTWLEAEEADLLKSVLVDSASDVLKAQLGTW